MFKSIQRYRYSFIAGCLIAILTGACFSGAPVQSTSATHPPTDVTNRSTAVVDAAWASELQDPLAFPDDIGWIDIKRDYGAAGDGETDDTLAIQQALDAPYADFTRPKMIYFPAGTYRVSDTLQWPLGRYKCCVSFQGQGMGQTVIQLRDQTPGFDDPGTPKALITTKQGNEAFRHTLRDLTIDTGSGNPGAIAIDYVSNNRGAIENVALRSGDGQGQIGLAMVRPWPGPSLIKHVVVEGFDYGIRVDQPEYGLTFEHIQLRHQNIAGILNEQNSIAIRDLHSTNTVPVLQNRRGGLVILLDGTFQGGDGRTVAIDNDAFLYARHLVADGYQATIQTQGQVVSGDPEGEYLSHDAYHLFDSPARSLNLPIEDTPGDHNSDLEQWGNIRDYPTFQAALDSGKSTLYFPMGRHRLQGTFTIPPTVKRIVGFESFVNLDDPSQMVLRLENSEDAEPLILEGLILNGLTLDHQSGRSLVIQHCQIKGPGYRNSVGTGKLFLEDVQMDLTIDHPQQVWARQLNAESLRSPRTKIVNHGGTLWVLGIKTEGKGPVLETTDGGQSEILGTLVYPVRRFEPTEQDQAAFINDESGHSLIYAVSASGPNRNYPIQVRETRDGTTKTLSTREMRGRVMPLFVGYPSSS